VSAKPKSVLMVGGPADGKWMVTDDPIIFMAEPLTIDWKAEAPKAPLIKQVQYYVQTFAIFGFSVNVAVAERAFLTSREQEKAVIKALMQRDVAAAMGVE
jgi:hypothetical protein